MTQKTYTVLNDELTRELSDGAFSGLTALEASTTERRLALIQREFRHGQDSMAKQIEIVKEQVGLLRNNADRPRRSCLCALLSAE